MEVTDCSHPLLNFVHPKFCTCLIVAISDFRVVVFAEVDIAVLEHDVAEFAGLVGAEWGEGSNYLCVACGVSGGKACRLHAFGLELRAAPPPRWVSLNRDSALCYKWSG